MLDRYDIRVLLAWRTRDNCQACNGTTKSVEIVKGNPDMSKACTSHVRTEQPNDENADAKTYSSDECLLEKMDQPACNAGLVLRAS